MAGNPFTQLGSLNKLRGSIKFTSNSSLNITPQFLGANGISLNFEGQATRPNPVNVGVVPSPEVYLQITLGISLVKTLAIAAAWKAQVEDSSLLGDMVVRLDVDKFPPFDLSNGFILNPETITAHGVDPNFPLRLQGTWYINNSLWP